MLNNHLAYLKACNALVMDNLRLKHIEIQELLFLNTFGVASFKSCFRFDVKPIHWISLDQANSGVSRLRI